MTGARADFPNCVSLSLLLARLRLPMHESSLGSWGFVRGP